MWCSKSIEHYIGQWGLSTAVANGNKQSDESILMIRGWYDLSYHV